jgi:heterodisulfide reductase subunit A-like polyferredoxin
VLLEMARNTFYFLFATFCMLATFCRTTASTTRQTSSNVVIIGGGAAGLAAALEASSRAANIYLLEKLPKVGGNSAKASSG